MKCYCGFRFLILERIVWLKYIYLKKIRNEQYSASWSSQTLCSTNSFFTSVSPNRPAWACRGQSQTAVSLSFFPHTHIFIYRTTEWRHIILLFWQYSSVGVFICIYVGRIIICLRQQATPPNLLPRQLVKEISCPFWAFHALSPDRFEVTVTHAKHACLFFKSGINCIMNITVITARLFWWLSSRTRNAALLHPYFSD